MNNKDKKQLKGMASLMPSVVQIGKDGLSDAVIDSARAAITARELIKAHVLNNANLPTKETMEDLADMLGAELIQVIGHYGVLFKKKDKKSHYEIIKDYDVRLCEQYKQGLRPEETHRRQGRVQHHFPCYGKIELSAYGTPGPGTGGSPEPG